MTALEVSPAATLRPPSFWRSFATLFAKERAQNLPLLGFVVLGMLLAQLLIWWRAPAAGSFGGQSGSSPRLALAALLTLVPILFALFKGFWQVRSEFAQHTQILLQTLPARGLAVMLAKYSWLWVEVLILSAVAFGGLFLFLAATPGALLTPQIGGTPVALDARFWWEVAKLTFLAALTFAPLPALALTATTLGRLLRRYDLLVSFAAYAALIFALGYVYAKVAQWNLDLPGISLFGSYRGIPADATSIPGEFLLLPVLATGALLVLAGKLFERHDA